MSDAEGSHQEEEEEDEDEFDPDEVVALDCACTSVPYARSCFV
jgi:hypothetical protein